MIELYEEDSSDFNLMSKNLLNGLQTLLIKNENIIKENKVSEEILVESRQLLSGLKLLTCQLKEYF